ncbi:PIG-L deacetylase family protein [Luteibacter sp. 9133]|uniref:PIG-L deacetylase family protein n=1 Tax=Luteibacter sp. 9133 TaxID=1500891 RepID=UPI0005BBFCF8|nr:PIG-L deacetylase family protein [Luteibacter sp. 9133]
MTDGDGEYIASLRRLPLTSPEHLLAGRALVVIAPHPDDESLGMGGLLASAQSMGTPVTVVFLTDGEGSHVGSPSFPPETLARWRRAEATDALFALGIPPTSARFLALGDARLDALSATTREAAMNALRACVPSPALVCVTARTDPHGDHRAASSIVNDIDWPEGVAVMEYPVWTWLADETGLPTQAATGYRVDVTTALVAKRRAIAAHRSQHGGVITDAEHAFELEASFLAMFDHPTETLVWPTR